MHKVRQEACLSINPRYIYCSLNIDDQTITVSHQVMQAAMAQQPGQAATAQVQQVQQAQGAAAPQAQPQQQAQSQAQAQPQAQQPPMMLQVDGAGDTSSEEDEDEEEEYDEDDEEEKDKDGGEDGQVEEVGSAECCSAQQKIFLLSGAVFGKLRFNWPKSNIILICFPPGEG